jgi:hypothetical protein
MSASRPRITAALVLGAALVLAGCSSSSTSQPSAGISTVASTPPAAHHTASAAALAARLEAAGLPVRHLIVYTAASDPNHLLGRQGGYTSKVAWVDPRAARQDAGDTRGSIGLGGGIEVFPDAASARARYERLRGFQPPFGDGYDYLSGTVILRLSQYLTPAQARAWKVAFTAAVQQP